MKRKLITSINKKYLMILGVVLVIIITFSFIFFTNNQKQIKQVCYKKNCFSVEIANTLQERENGLMFRQNLGENNGMFFIFPYEGQYSFWMKNMLFPLDIIWINAQKEVVFISNNTLPCNETCEPINPGVKAKYVLEINARSVEKIGLKVGDRLDF